MKCLVIGLIFALSGAPALLPAQSEQDSPLVKAAKASGGRRKPKGKVITNADVKKAGEKSMLPPSKSAATTPAPPPKTMTQKLNEQRAAAAAVSKRVSEAEKQVSRLEKELSRIEQTYYESNDPNYRDKEITARFNQIKGQLDIARKELADAKDAEKKVTPKATAQAPSS